MNCRVFQRCKVLPIQKLEVSTSKTIGLDWTLKFMKNLKVVPYPIHVYLVKGAEGKSQDPRAKANLPAYDEIHKF